MKRWKYKFYKDPVIPYYPVGLYFPRVNSYAESIASVLHKQYGKEVILPKICLIARGSSGAVIAATVAYILYNKWGYTVKIIMSRKEGESAHGSNMQGFRDCLTNGYKVIIVDDFISSGRTLTAILKDIDSHISEEKYHENDNYLADMLCISNRPADFQETSMSRLFNDIRYVVVTKK
jgi:hypoxanthine phosphoribosyltransferase